LLAGQAFFLGLTTAWIGIPASAIFLETYGSGLLPLTYIGAAVAGAATSAALGVAVRRRPLVSVAIQVLVVLAVVLLASWLVLWRRDADWLSFGLLVLVPIVVPVGFMLIVAQAGMLLDVRALKSLYGRVIAGFAFGFVAGGLIGPVLISLLGNTEHLLAGGAVAAAMFMLLVLVTRQNFAAELSDVDDGDDEVERPTLRSLLRHRYVMLIVGFQMLSAVESQWLDFLVFDRAGKRYADTEELARFISLFLAIAYGADIIFLLLVAGALMSRFGLRYGLTANPAVVLVLLATMITAASFQGSGTTAVFLVVVATRVSDLVLADGAARTSLSAAYQAVPTRVRLSAQAAVEGLAVPVAIGLSGLLLIILRWTVGTDGMALPILTSVVVVAWAVVAFFVYRDYRVNLLSNLRHRSLDPTELMVEDASTLAAIHRLIDSADERDVRLGLDTLTVVAPDELVTRLQSLAMDDRVGVRSDVLDRLVRFGPGTAAEPARNGLSHPDPEVRTASVRALGTVGSASDLSAITTCFTDGSADVQVAAVTAMLQLGDHSNHRQVAVHIETLSSAESADELVVAARMLGVTEHSTAVDRRVLASLLEVSDHNVVNAGLGAIRWPVDLGMFESVVSHLESRSTAGAAVEALARSGDMALDVADEGLRGDLRLDQHGNEQLARLCRVIGGPRSAAVLSRHAGHRDREVGLAVLTALAAVGSEGADETAAPTGRRDKQRDEMHGSEVLRADLEHASQVLRALVTLEQTVSADVLRSALSDELELLRRRVLASLAIRYGTDELSMVAFQLSQHSTRFHALAMEWLDVTLVGIDRATVALLEPDSSPSERLTMLSRWFTTLPATPASVLVDIAHDPDHRWRRPWLTACAILAGADFPDLDLEELALSAMDRSPTAHNAGQADIVLETITAIRRRRATQPA
jgi:HEAT repeat protein